MPFWDQCSAATIWDAFVLGIFYLPIPQPLRKLGSQFWSWHVLPWVIATIFSCGLGAPSMSQYLIAGALMDGAIAVLTAKSFVHFRREFADRKTSAGIIALAIGIATLGMSTAWIEHTSRQRELNLPMSAQGTVPTDATALGPSVWIPQVSPAKVRFTDRGQVFQIAISNPGPVTTYGNVFEFSIVPSAVRAAEFEIQPDPASMRPLIVQPLNGPYPVGDMFWLAGNNLPSQEPVLLLWIYSLQPFEKRLMNLQIATPVKPAPMAPDLSPLPPPAPIDATIQGMVMSFNQDAEPMERRGDRVLITMSFPSPMEASDEALCLFRPAPQCIDGPLSSPAKFQKGPDTVIIEGWTK